MKKVIFALFCLLIFSYEIQAQNDTVLNVTQLLEGSGRLDVCKNKYDRVIVYAAENCNDFCWWIYGNPNYENPLILNQSNNHYGVNYIGCGINSHFEVFWYDTTIPTETTEELWKRQYEPITLEAVGADSADMYTYFWPHNGATTPTVEVTSQGNYQCHISDMCATAVRTKNVKENVEIDLATCDLESNLNMVTWQTNPAQAQYIDHVIVKRDGLQVGTANYSDGAYLDAIGSGAASRTYTLVAIATDGTECPIVSYPKETIHMAYLTGMNNTIEVNWNIPTGYDLLGYNICEWHPGAKDGDLTVIDFVGASVTSYTCTENLFNNGHVVVQGVENGKSESRLLSNRSEEGIVGIGEHQNKTFKIYPNPSTGVFTVEGASNLTVFNTLGQVIATSHSENGTHTFSLRSGIYFIKSDEGTVQKVVVE